MGTRDDERASGMTDASNTRATADGHTAPGSDRAESEPTPSPAAGSTPSPAAGSAPSPAAGSAPSPAVGFAREAPDAAATSAADDVFDTRLRSAGGLLWWSPQRPPVWRVFRFGAFLFIVYPVVTVLAARSDAIESLLAVGATLVFLLLLYIGWRTPSNDRRRESWIGPAAVLAIDGIAIVLTAYARENWLAFFYYAATGASPLQPARRSSTLILISGIAAAATLGLRGSPIPEAVLQGFSVAVIGLLVLSANETRRMNRALIEARHELARLAVAEERNRIARDLHDTLGHSLSLITLKSELAGRLLPADPDRARTEIADVERAARDALASVRETVSGYRRPTLGAELASARSALAAADIEIHVDAPQDALPAAVDAVLAWTVREGVTNVVRHSSARHVSIRIDRRGDWAEAWIEDDGAPRPQSAVSSGSDVIAATAGDRQAGTGLAGLRERVAALGGEFTAARTAHGFVLRVQLPLEVGS